MKTTMSFNGEPAPDDDKILKPLFKEWIECNEILNAALSVLVFKQNQFCGIFLARKYDENNENNLPKYLELGHFYKKQYHGNGFITLASSKMTKLCFEIECIEEIVGKIKSDNLNSQAVIIRSGFRFHNHYKQGDILINVYKLTKESCLKKTYNTQKFNFKVRDYIAFSNHYGKCPLTAELNI